jgi:cobalt-zinc-cadmium efflux system outer membrane protein
VFSHADVSVTSARGNFRNPSMIAILRIVLLLLLVTANTRAEKAGHIVTFEKVVAQALADNPELRFYEAEIAAASGDRRTAGTWPNPELSTEIGRKRVSGDMATEGTAWFVSVTQTFEWPGRVSLRKAIAERQIGIAQMGLEQFRSALAAQVRQKAFALYGAQQRELAAQEVAARGEELVGTLVQREPAGVAPLLETRAIEASVIKLRRQAIEASNEAQSALYDLNALRGRAISDPLVIADVPMEFPEFPEAEALIRRAGRGNFKLKQREIELSQQGFKVRLAANEAWPSISVGPQFSQEKAGREKETVAGVGVSVPLPLWNRNQGGVQSANARLQQAEASLKLMQREIERKIRENASNYERLRKELTRLSPKAAEQLREAALLADRHYRLGAVPLATYLEVQQSYLEALAAIFSTQAEALSARAELDLLTGTSVPATSRAETTQRQSAASVATKDSSK